MTINEVETTSCDLDMQGIKALIKQKKTISSGGNAQSAKWLMPTGKVSIHKRLFSISLMFNGCYFGYKSLI